VIAADTNVVIRLLTADDPRQTEQARVLFDTETILLPKSVLLEVAWVLRRLYHLRRAPIVQALDELVALPNVRCEDAPAIHQALEWMRDGMDVADAFHLASSRSASRFATFDRRLAKMAAKIGVPVSEP